MTAPTSTIATFPDYPLAQSLVDRMSDEGFPVERVRIVGRGLSTVEQVTGRFTTGSAALYGAGSGAMLGLLIGLLFGVFTIGGWLSVLLTSVAVGAVWGVVFGALAHWATGGLRDFRSITALTAAHYDVEVDPSYAEQAHALSSL